MPAVVLRPCKGLPGGVSIEAWTSEPGSCVRRMKKRRGTAMQNWEYAVTDFTKLERLGGEGWEAVGLISTWGAGWRMVHPVVLLKRTRPEPAEQGSRDGTAR